MDDLFRSLPYYEGPFIFDGRQRAIVQMFFETLSRFRCPLPVNGSGGQAAANFRPMSEESILRYTDLAALNQISDIGRQTSAVSGRSSDVRVRGWNAKKR